MENCMKLAIVGDTHFGIKDGSSNALTYQKHFFDEMLIPECNKRKVDGIVFLGDIFHNRRNVNMFILSNVIQIFNKIKEETNVKLYGIEGNHDMYFRNSYDVATVREMNLGDMYYGKDGYYVVEDCLFIHWKNSAEEYKELFKEIKKNYNAKSIHYIFGHFAIQGAYMIGGRTDDNETDLVESDFFKAFPNVKQVFSGHFHKPSKLKKKIRYVGIPYDLTWNDVSNTLGLTFVDTESGMIEYIPNNLKVFNGVRLDSTTADNFDMEKYLNDIPELDYKMVYKIIYDGKEYESLAKNLYNEILLKNHDALLIDEKIYNISDYIEDDIPAKDIKSLDELILNYFKSSKLIPDEERDDYYELFKMLSEEVKGSSENLEIEL